MCRLRQYAFDGDSEMDAPHRRDVPSVGARRRDGMLEEVERGTTRRGVCVAIAIAWATSACGCSFVISTDDLEPAGPDAGSDVGGGADSTHGDAPVDTTTTDSGGDTTTPPPPDTSPPPDTTTPPDTTPPPDTAPPPDASGCETGTVCGPVCTNLSTDPRSCGSCGKACTAAQSCAGGTCSGRMNLTHCDSPAVGGSCVDLQGDGSFCGSCGKTCGALQHCVDGGCVTTVTSCPTGRTACTSGTSSGSCFDLVNDPTHCGACGTACAVDEFCIAGKCTRYEPVIGPCGSIACTAQMGASAHCCVRSSGNVFCALGSPSTGCPTWW